MKLELINKQTAFRLWEAVKDQAHGFSKAYNRPIAEIDEPCCVEFIKYAKFTQLQDGESCVFVDGSPAKWLTDFTLENGEKVIGDLCFKGAVKAEFENDLLVVSFDDSVKEYYRLNESGLFEIEKNSLGTKVRAERNIFN